jgi:hypothetical protein
MHFTNESTSDGDEKQQQIKNPVRDVLQKLLECTDVMLHTVYLINQSKRKTSNVQNLRHLGHEHQAPNHEATQQMMGY